MRIIVFQVLSLRTDRRRIFCRVKALAIEQAQRTCERTRALRDRKERSAGEKDKSPSIVAIMSSQQNRERLLLIGFWV